VVGEQYLDKAVADVQWTCFSRCSPRFDLMSDAWQRKFWPMPVLVMKWRGGSHLSNSMNLAPFAAEWQLAKIPRRQIGIFSWWNPVPLMGWIGRQAAAALGKALFGAECFGGPKAQSPQRPRYPGSYKRIWHWAIWKAGSPS